MRKKIKIYLRGLLDNANTNRIPYHTYRSLMLEQRSTLFTEKQEPGLLSIVTSVWNTSPTYLEELVQSVITQQGGTNFEWIILDNGSTNQDTINYLKKLDQYPFIRQYRIEKNLGIINGMRILLERSTGKYIIPMDSDDCLYPDAITIITSAIKQEQYPALLYSDEDKIQPDGSYGWPYFKPNWDPILFINTCYIAHLCVIDRQKALELGAYTDSAADGSHDWDTFVRFYNAGFIPKHISEVIYSWRMHSQSTAMNMGSKDYLETSQLTVLNRFLAAQPFKERYYIDKSPLFSEGLNWWIRRHSVATRKVLTIVLVDEPSTYSPSTYQSNNYPLYEVKALPLNSSTIPELLKIATAEKENNTLIHCIWQKMELPKQEWINEVLLNFELFPDTVALGGRVFGPQGQILAAGNFFGYGDGCGCPDESRPFYDRGYFGRLWKPHSVGCISSQHIVFDATFLAELLGTSTESPLSIYYLGEWAGAYARRKNKRIVYSPFFSSVTSANWYKHVTPEEKKSFKKINHDLFSKESYLSKHINATGKVSYSPWTNKMRDKHLDSLNYQ